MSDLNAAAERLQGVTSLDELVGVLMDPDVQALLAHPKVGEGWKTFMEKRRAELSAPPPAPEVPEAQAPPVAPGILGKQPPPATAKEAAEPEEISMEAVASWVGKKLSELTDEEYEAAYSELVGMATETYEGNVEAARSSAEKFLSKAEGEDWELDLEGARSYFERGVEFQETWRAVSEDLRQAGIFLVRGLLPAVQDRERGLGMRLILVKARRGDYGPTRPFSPGFSVGERVGDKPEAEKEQPAPRERDKRRRRK